MSSRPFAGIFVAALLTLGACASDSDQAPVTRGVAEIWLASNAPSSADLKFTEMRPVIEIDGVVAGLASGPAAPPAGMSVFFAGQGASQVLAIRDDAGLDWKLGYHIGRGTPATNATPALDALVGTRVRLLFRAVRGFGVAPGFVLFDAQGAVRFAMDLAVYGDPLRADDVPGLTVRDGAVIARTKDDCADLEDTSLVFSGAPPVELLPGAQGMVSIQSKRYTAINLFSFRSRGQSRCPDYVGAGRAWAIWPAP